MQVFRQRFHGDARTVCLPALSVSAMVIDNAPGLMLQRFHRLQVNIMGACPAVHHDQSLFSLSSVLIIQFFPALKCKPAHTFSLLLFSLRYLPFFTSPDALLLNFLKNTRAPMVCRTKKE